VKPTRRTLVLLAAGMLVALLPAAGVPRAWPLLVAFWGAAAVALGADAILSPRAGDLDCESEWPDALHVGGSEPLTITVTLAGARRVPLELALDLSDGFETQPHQSGTASGEPARFTWALAPVRRGVATIEGLWLSWESRFGWWTTTVFEPLDRELPVLPNLPRVRAQAIRFFADREFRAGLKVERYRGEGSEFDSLKEYLPGDDHRTIDWKASARHRLPVCRQHRAERDHQVVLAIDSGRLMSEPVEGLCKLDHAINGALLLAYVCLATGDRVGLFTFDSRVGTALDPVRGAAGMRPLLDATSRIRYSTDETNFTLGLTSLAQRLRRRSLVILLTDFVDTVTAELMLENVGRMTQRHLVVFLSIRDPLLGELAEAPPVDEAALGRAVVARHLIRDRELVHLRLRRAGVRALDVPPARVAPGLINQYLDIKRREKI
jgi:uncharacterized protein (DUF58 family)